MMDISAHHPADASILEELENNRQELHAARRHLEVLTANVKHLENENLDLNNALSEISKKHKDLQSCDQGKSDAKYRQQMAEIQQMLEESQASEKLAKETIKRLEEQLRVAVEAASRPIVASVDNDDDIAALQLQVSNLEEEKTNLKLKLCESSLGLKQKTDEVTRLLQELAEKEEESQFMQSQFTAQCNITERLREENSEMRAHLETETGHVDVDKKGNSLFAEVDDRRILAERRFVEMEAALRELKEKLTKEQTENKRLKRQIHVLRQTSTKGSDDNVVNYLQAHLVETKRTIISLTEQLQKREAPKHKPAYEAKPSFWESASDNDKLFINYLQGIITQKSKEAEEARKQAEQNHMQALRTDLHMTEVQHEVRTLTNDLNRLRAMNSYLTIDLQEMQRKYEPELFAPPSKGMIKIPLSESECHSLSQNDKQRQPVVATQNTGGIQERTNTHITSSAHHEEQKSKKDGLPTVGFDMCSKENIPLKPEDDPVSGPGKSVRMMPQVAVISSQGEHNLEELKTDRQGQKVKKLQGGEGGTGRYKSINYVTLANQPTECKQQ
ncbi:hypothetical protein BsWGS_26913 [Bradybaena similaris]